jgi:K+-sensing histidine kinase KdpD
MTPVLMRNAKRIHPSSTHLDTVRALCHDLRQPLAAILLLAGARDGDVEHRFSGILDQAQWLADMVESVIGGAADDLPENTDVVDLALGCVQRARTGAGCDIGLVGVDHAFTVVAPVALGRALNSLLDNAVRAAGPGGQVTVEVSGTVHEIAICVIDNGPGLGNVPTHNALGLTITRALVSACGGGFELQPGVAGGVVARIVLPGDGSTSVAC